MDLLDRLLANDRWNTGRILQLSRGLSESEFNQPFDVGHQTLGATLEHMIFSLEVWAAAMAGEPMPDQTAESSPEAWSDRHERAAASFAALARQLSDQQRLDDTFLDPWIEAATPRTFGTTIVHVLLHNAQHRNEALHILQRLGVANLPDGDPKEWEEATQAIK